MLNFLKELLIYIAIFFVTSAHFLICVSLMVVFRSDERRRQIYEDYRPWRWGSKEVDSRYYFYYHGGLEWQYIPEKLKQLHRAEAYSINQEKAA